VTHIHTQLTSILVSSFSIFRGQVHRQTDTHTNTEWTKQYLTSFSISGKQVIKA